MLSTVWRDSADYQCALAYACYIHVTVIWNDESIPHMSDVVPQLLWGLFLRLQREEE